MDEMKLKVSTKFMRSMIAKIITKTIRKKLGYKVDMDLIEVEASIVDGQVHIHTNVDIDIDKDEFMRIITTIGSD